MHILISKLTFVELLLKTHNINLPHTSDSNDTSAFLPGFSLHLPLASCLLPS